MINGKLNICATLLLATIVGACGGGQSASTVATPIPPPPPPPTGVVFPGNIQIVSLNSVYQSPQNLVEDPSFEADGVGWTLESGVTIGNVGVDSSKGLRFETTDNTVQATSTQFDVVANHSYLLSFDTRTAHGVVDPGWSGKITEESTSGDDLVSLVINGTILWHTSSGDVVATSRNVTYSLNSWRTTSVEIIAPTNATAATVVLTAQGSLPNDTDPHVSWFDNVRVVDKTALTIVHDVPMAAVETDNGFVLDAAIGGFDVHATYVVDNNPPPTTVDHYARISLEIGHDAGQQAFELIYKRPFDATHIQYDISRSETIGASGNFGDATEADFYSDLTMSAVPLTTVSDGVVTKGIAVDLEQPVVFIGQYNRDDSTLEMRFSLGLAGPGTTATLDLVELDVDTPNAYRNAWQGYLDLVRPQVSEVPRPMAGGTVAKSTALFEIFGTSAFPHSTIPDFDGLLSDLGIRYIDNGFAPSSLTDTSLFDFFAAQGLEAFTYDYPWIVEQKLGGIGDAGGAGDEAVPPSYQDVSDAIEFLATDFVPPNPDGILKQLRSQNVAYEANGDLMINRVWAPFSTNFVWSMRNPVQLVGTDYIGVSMTEKYLPILQLADQSVGPVRGIGLDGFMKETKVLNTQLVGSAPFTFDPNTGQVRSLMAASDIQYMRDFRVALDSAGYSDRLIGGNTTDIGTAQFGWPLLDSATWEADPQRGNNFGHKEVNARRMLMPGKRIEILLNSDWSIVPANRLAVFLEFCALSGAYPGLLNRTFPPPGITNAVIQQEVRNIWRNAIPVFDDLHENGWQLFSHVAVSGSNVDDVRVERFGNGLPMFLSVLNSQDGIIDLTPSTEVSNVTLALDTDALGIADFTSVSVVLGAAENIVFDLESGATISFDLLQGRGAVIRID